MDDIVREGYSVRAIGWAIIALGAAAVAPKRQVHNLMKLPSFDGVVEVRSSLPGRMRLYVPAVAANPELAAQTKAQLEGTGAVRCVAIEPRTASVLILYNEAQVSAAVAEGAFIKLMGLDAQLNTASDGRLLEGWRALRSAVNRSLLSATNGLLGLRAVAGTALGVTALKRIAGGNPGVPGAMTLLWWATMLFGGKGDE